MVKLMVKSHRERNQINELRRPFDTHPGPALALRGRKGARAPRQPPEMPASHLADGGFAQMMERILRRAEQPAESVRETTEVGVRAEEGRTQKSAQAGGGTQRCATACSDIGQRNLRIDGPQEWDL